MVILYICHNHKTPLYVIYGHNSQFILNAVKKKILKMSTYEISKSSLLSLKAEILRKQQELVKVKAGNDVKIKLIKKNTPLEIRNKGIEARQNKDLEEVDADLLKQSRTVLEAKTILYEKLSSGKLSKEEQERKGRFLVRFDKKNKSGTNDLPPSDSEDEPDRYPESDQDQYQSDEEANMDQGEKWVDYTDCLGRTRKCLQKDLAYIMSKDKELKRTVEVKDKNEQLNKEFISDQKDEKEVEDVGENQTEVMMESELLSSDMRREVLRQQWEKEEDELRKKSDIHYQDILFGEARTHGVGYYGFSKDEEERAKQQDALNKLRQETEEKQKRAQELKALREKQLAARIKAAKDRKRSRLGLPPEEEPAPIPEEKISEEEKNKQEDLKQKEEEKEKILEEARKGHVRPWDIGKEGVKEHYEMTQEEWIEKQRSERQKEFAPPTSYRTEFRSAVVEPQIENDQDKSLNFTTKKKVRPRSRRRKNKIPVTEYTDQSMNLMSGKYTPCPEPEENKYITCDEFGDFEAIGKNEASDQTQTPLSKRPEEFAPSTSYRKEFRSAVVEPQVEDDQDKSLNFTTKRRKRFRRRARRKKRILPGTNEHGSFEEISQNKPMQPARIINCEDPTDFDDNLLRDYAEAMKDIHKNSNKVDSEISDSDTERGVGVEIAPPPSFEYYGPSYSKRPKILQKKGDIEDSVEAGLKFLRKQVEEKEKSTKHPREMFLS